jgi:hypothetical protein
MAAKKNEPKSEPMTYTVVRMPNIRHLMIQGAGEGEVTLPEPETTKVEINTETGGKG